MANQKLLNWPPSKGPKPPALACRHVYDVPPVVQRDFKFKQPPVCAGERRMLLDAVMDHHGKRLPEEKVGTSTNEEEFAAAQRRRGAPRYETHYRLNHQVAMLGTLTLPQADMLVCGYGVRLRRLGQDLPPKPITVGLLYPLEVGSELHIKPYRYVLAYGDGKEAVQLRMTVGYVLWCVAQEYLRIYKEWRHYVVWGHELADLYFEVLDVRPGGRADLFVGS